MNTLKKLFKTLSVCFLIAGLGLLAACGGSSSSSSSTELSGGTTDVAVDEPLTVTFTTPIDVDTVTSESLFVVEAPASEDISVAKSFDSSACDPAAALDALISCETDISCSVSLQSLLEYSTNYIMCLTSAIFRKNSTTPYGEFSLSFTTADPTQTKLYLFPTDDEVAADFGGRTAADTACQTTHTNTYADVSCVNGVRALISMSASDEIRDMPTNYGVSTSLEIDDAANSDTKIADDWADLLDGSIDNALTVSWWSGSSDAGADNDFNCTEWTAADGSSGTIGDAGETGMMWIDDSGALCNQSYKLMCLCY